MSSRAFDVVVCGSLHLDIMVHAPSLPRLDETTVGTRWAMKCGGKGGNQAVMAARAGARVAMIGRVGADDFGERLRAHLIAHEVDASEVGVDASAGSGMSAAIVQNDGEYGAVIVSGANLRIDPADVESQWRALGGARALVLQNEIPELVNIAAATVARASGATVILNAAPARPMSPQMLDLADILVINRVEAEMLSGVAVSDPASAFAALPRLGSDGRDVIVTLGGAGLVVKPRGAEPKAMPSIPVDVISTHGAGDCFVGALARRLASGASLVESTAAANEAAAAYVSGNA